MPQATTWQKMEEAGHSAQRLFQRHLRSLVWVGVWFWDWIHSHTPPSHAVNNRQVALKQAQVTSVAVRLCRMQGLLVSSVDEVMDESSGETMLMRQAALGNEEGLCLLVDAGTRRDAADGKGQTAIIYAGAAGQRETALALVQECGADASTARNDGATPVLIAARNGHTGTVRALVQE